MKFHCSSMGEVNMSKVNEFATLRNFIEAQKERENLVDRYNWLKAMIDQVPDYIYAKDVEGRFLFANQAVVTNNGFDSVEELIGLTDAEIHSEANGEAHNIDVLEQKVIVTGEPSIGGDERRLKGEGWLMMSRVPLRDQSGKIIGVVGASQDITARKRAEEFMSAHSQLLQEVAAGCEPTLFLEKSRSLLATLFPGKGVILTAEKVDTSPGTTLLSRRCQGTVSSIQLVVPTDATNEPGALKFLDGLLETVAIAFERHHNLSQVAYLAVHDALTGLSNRSGFEQLLEQRLSNSTLPVAVAFLDLDHFKLVNDSLGHGCGDQLLIAVAERLVAAVEDDDVVARLGGDEFVFIIQGFKADVVERLQRLLSAIGEQIAIAGTLLQVTASIGVAFNDGTLAKPTNLLANADMALYAAKEKGRNGVVVFSQEMADAARDKLIRLEELRRAILLDEFSLLYQPQIDAHSQEIVGVEVLVRWKHPTRGVVSPAEFIPLAEEAGLIIDIDSIVMKKACQQLRDWLDEGFAPVRLAINVSARQFSDDRFLQFVKTCLAQSRIDPGMLEIEITEGLIMTDPDQAISVMNELKVLGTTLSVDDFGTGYSSLSMLKRFPISRLKIDRSFLANIPDDKENMAITEAIIGLAKALQLDVVAEGVETIEQLKFLRAAGCETFQGFYFARPLAADDTSRWLAKRQLI